MPCLMVIETKGNTASTAGLCEGWFERKIVDLCFMSLESSACY